MAFTAITTSKLISHFAPCCAQNKHTHTNKNTNKSNLKNEGLFGLWFEGLESITVARHGGSWSHCTALRCREIVAGAELAFFCIFYSV